MTTTIASAIASKNCLIVWRFSGASWVAAKANANVKTISGKMPSLAAALIGLVGIMAFKNSPNGGGASDGATAPSAPRKASAAPCGIGIMAISAGVRSAAIMVTVHKMTSIVKIARVASFPVLAASTVCNMPVTSKATTNGTTVMRKPLSHIVPTTSATSLSNGTASPVAIPSSSPATRANKINNARFIRILPKARVSLCTFR